MGFGKMLAKDTTAAIAWYDLFPYLKPVLEWLFKKWKEEFAFIPLWGGHKNRYLYHIDPECRDTVYRYLADDDILKKVGLVFGNDLAHGGKLFDLGIYAFMPFYELYQAHGKKTVIDANNGKAKEYKVHELCNIVGKNIKSSGKEDIEKAVKASKLLIKFALENCHSEDFGDLLLVPEDGYFAEAYKKVFEGVKEKSPQYKVRVLSRFLKASFRGMYVSSEGFAKLSLSARPSEAKEQAELIASKIGPSAAAFVKKVGRSNAFKKLIEVFENAKKADTQSINFVVTDSARALRLKMLFEAFKDLIYDFDNEVRRKCSTPAYRVPIILNVYRDESSGILRSLLAGYNEQSKEPRVQQIKCNKKKFSAALKRCLATATKYCIFMEELLPSEEQN